jgi:hypothetical protein
METLEGAPEGLANIKALFYPTEVSLRKRGMGEDEEELRETGRRDLFRMIGGCQPQCLDSVA